MGLSLVEKIGIGVVAAAMLIGAVYMAREDMKNKHIGKAQTTVEQPVAEK